MTVEQKLDWLLDKAHKGELDLGKKDEETGFLNDQAFQQKIYGFHKPGTKEAIAADHEWEQLKDQLFEDELLQEDYMGNWVLSLKGKVFHGYVRQKWEKRIKYYLRIVNLIIITAGSLAAGLYGIFEIWKYYNGYIPK